MTAQQNGPVLVVITANKPTRSEPLRQTVDWRRFHIIGPASVTFDATRVAKMLESDELPDDDTPECRMALFLLGKRGSYV